MKRAFSVLTVALFCANASAQLPPAGRAQVRESVQGKEKVNDDKHTVPLKKGDRIVFFGDSITAGGVGKTGYITVMKESLAKLKAAEGVELIGAGVSGNKVPDLQNRVDKAVIARKPTIVFIYIGINDVWHGDSGRGTPKDKYEAGLKDIITKIKAGGAQVILCTPTVIGEKANGTNKHDAQLDEYAAVSRAVAKELKVPLCDLRKAFVDYLKTNNPKNKEAGILTTDRVHLNTAGNKLVADTMLGMFVINVPAKEASPSSRRRTASNGGQVQAIVEK